MSKNNWPGKGARVLGFKIKPMVILSILILSILFINYNFEISALDSKREYHNSKINSQNSCRNNDFNWGQIEIISEPIFGQNNNIENSAEEMQIAVEDDKVYVVWVDTNDTNGAGTDCDIFFRYFDGIKWSDIQVISETVPGMNFNTGDCFYPRIAVEDGRIYVIWYDNNNTNNAGTDFDISFRCNLTGTHWEDIQVISEPVPNQNINTGESKSCNIAVENGKIYIVWEDSNDTNGAGTDRDLFYRCNLTGSYWEPVQVISEPVPGKNFNTGDCWLLPKIEVENGILHVIWTDINDTNNAGGNDEDIFYRRNLTGSSWEPVQVISEPVAGQNINTQHSECADLAVDDGRLYVIWREEMWNLNGCGTDREIFFRCNLSGMNWEQIQVISEPVFGKDYNTASSSILQDGISVENGNIHVVWTDYNNTNGAGTDWDIHYRYNLSEEGWGSIKVISEPIEGSDNNGNCNFPSIAICNGKAHIIWNNWGSIGVGGYNSGPDADVAYRWVAPSSSPLFFSSPKVTPFSGNTSTEFNFTVKYFHLNNSPPTGVKVFIDGKEHSMLEVEPTDINYIDGKEYFFKIKNIEIGSHNYSFWASNGTKIITKHFKNFPKVENTPPKIITQDNLTAYEDTYYQVNYEFEDMDTANVGQPISWDFNTNASWLYFVSNPPTLYGTPTNDDVGKYWVHLIIDDSYDTTFTNFTLTVIDLNDKPIIKTKNIEQVYEDKIYEVDYDAIDIDSPIERQKWSLETNTSSWLQINSSSGILNGTPTNDDVGFYWVNVTVNDSENGYDFTNFSLEVINVNDPPIIITENVNTTTTGIYYQVDYNATDIDSPLTKQVWTLRTSASWLSMDSETGIISGTPSRQEFGQFNVNITVNDGDGGFDWRQFILKVFKSNEPPVIITSDQMIAYENQLYYTDYNGTDDSTPAEILSWSLKTNASWLILDSRSGILSGIPSPNDVGCFWVNISLTDSENALDHHNFTITVLPEPVKENNKPNLLNYKLSPSQGTTKTEFQFSVYYLDTDSEPPVKIQVVIDEIPYNMILWINEIAYRGVYQFTTTLTEGEHTYYFTASDGTDTVNTDEFKTPYINKPKDEVDRVDSYGYLIVGGIAVVIIIIILIALFLVLKRKKKKEFESIETEQNQFQEPPQVYPIVIPQQAIIQTLDHSQVQIPELQIQQPIQTQAYENTPEYFTSDQQQQIFQPQQIEQPYEYKQIGEISAENLEQYPYTQEPEQALDLEQPEEISAEELEHAKPGMINGTEDSIEE